MEKRIDSLLITKTRLFKYIENFTSKNWKFSDKNSDIFHISAQNIDCGHSLELPRQGSSNEYPQSMFLSRNKKNNVYPCKPQFYYIKVGFKGVKKYIGMFSWYYWRLFLKKRNCSLWEQIISLKRCHHFWKVPNTTEAPWLIKVISFKT